VLTPGDLVGYANEQGTMPWVGIVAQAPPSGSTIAMIFWTGRRNAGCGTQSARRSSTTTVERIVDDRVLCLAISPGGGLW